MTAFVTDSLTDTNGTAITSHTGELGATWTKHASANNVGDPQIQSNALVTTENNFNENYYASGVPASADYTVSLDFTFNNAGANEICGPAARYSTSAATGYTYIYHKNGGGMRLFQWIAGGLTELATTVSFTPSNGVTYRMTIDVAVTAIKGRMQRLSDSKWLDNTGTFVVGASDTHSVTDSGVTAAGRAGWWFACDSPAPGARGTLDNFSADQAGASLPPAPNSTIVRQAMKRASFY